jgi:hypothetical protein
MEIIFESEQFIWQRSLNRIRGKCFSDEIESEEHLLICSFYYTSRRKLLETITNNINHSNFEKLSFGDKFSDFLTGNHTCILKYRYLYFLILKAI